MNGVEIIMIIRYPLFGGILFAFLSKKYKLPVPIFHCAISYSMQQIQYFTSEIKLIDTSFLYTEKENLCLYGFPSEQWEVNLPAEEVPPELPEPALGINFARDGMQEKDWLSLVAVHSDAWLLAVAFYFGARFGYDKADRYVILFILFWMHGLTAIAFEMHQ